MDFRGCEGEKLIGDGFLQGVLLARRSNAPQQVAGGEANRRLLRGWQLLEERPRAVVHQRGAEQRVLLVEEMQGGRTQEPHFGGCKGDDEEEATSEDNAPVRPTWTSEGGVLSDGSGRAG